MSSRAAKQQRRQAQSVRDHAASAARAAHQDHLDYLASQRACEEFGDRWRLGIPVEVRPRQWARLGIRPVWFLNPTRPYLAWTEPGQEPIDVALGTMPDGWPTGPDDYESDLLYNRGVARETVLGLERAVDLLADWLGFQGDRSVIPVLLALGGAPAAVTHVACRVEG